MTVYPFATNIYPLPQMTTLYPHNINPLPTNDHLLPTMTLLYPLTEYIPITMIIKSLSREWPPHRVTIHYATKPPFYRLHAVHTYPEDNSGRTGALVIPVKHLPTRNTDMELPGVVSVELWHGTDVVIIIHSQQNRRGRKWPTNHTHTHIIKNGHKILQFMKQWQCGEELTWLAWGEDPCPCLFLQGELL